MFINILANILVTAFNQKLRSLAGMAACFQFLSYPLSHPVFLKYCSYCSSKGLLIHILSNLVLTSLSDFHCPLLSQINFSPSIPPIHNLLAWNVVLDNRKFLLTTYSILDILGLNMYSF